MCCRLSDFFSQLRLQCSPSMLAWGSLGQPHSTRPPHFGVETRRKNFVVRFVYVVSNGLYPSVIRKLVVVRGRLCLSNRLIRQRCTCCTSSRLSKWCLILLLSELQL